jgi:GT2 family glycosyltransferase
MQVGLSFIVPFHGGLAALARCLDALARRPAGSELIVVSDGARQDCRRLAARHHARLIELRTRSGPAAARNRAAAVAAGDLLVFVDSDVVVSGKGLARLPGLASLFAADARLAAAFGAYDDRPRDPGFVSQYKNLAHSFMHRSSAGQVRTFWAGFGIVRRRAFHQVGGFDERLGRPSVEDIDLGYRLHRAGHVIVLDPALSACHLKRWTLRSAVVSDLRDRGIPWTQLILRYGLPGADLNLRAEHRWATAFTYLAATSLACAAIDPRFLAGTPSALLASTMVNRRFYRFLWQTRGVPFAAGAWGLHHLHHLSNGLSFAIGTALYVAARYLRRRLPGALPVDPWSRTFVSEVKTEPRGVWSADPIGP